MSSDKYIPGDYYVICDRCGFKRRVSTTRMTWDRLLVCYPECWDPRHPQDFVRARADKQAVPIARPDRDISLSSTTLSSGASKGDMSVSLTNTSFLSDGDGIGITLDSGKIQWVQITDVTNGLISDPLNRSAASGNTVYSSVSTQNFFIEPGSVTASSL